MPRIPAVVIASVTAAGCAALAQLGVLVQPPRFAEAPGRSSEIRLLTPSPAQPFGGAGVRLWAQVTNPNQFGFTLAGISGELFLEEARATSVELPLGLPLPAGGETVFPIDVSFSFADLPGLGEAVRRAAGRQPIGYRLEGTIGVEAGAYGTPTFGPMTLLEGTVR